MTYRSEDFPDHPDISNVVSAANAWLQVKAGVRARLATRPEILAIQGEVSRELFNNGCFSAAQHQLGFIEALMDKVEELTEELADLSKNSVA